MKDHPLGVQDTLRGVRYRKIDKPGNPLALIHQTAKRGGDKNSQGRFKDKPLLVQLQPSLFWSNLEWGLDKPEIPLALIRQTAKGEGDKNPQRRLKDKPLLVQFHLFLFWSNLEGGGREFFPRRNFFDLKTQTNFGENNALVEDD